MLCDLRVQFSRVASSAEHENRGRGLKILFHNRLADPGMQRLDLLTGHHQLAALLASKARDMFRGAVLFQHVIMVGWKAYFLASSAVVSSGWLQKAPRLDLAPIALSLRHADHAFVSRPKHGEGPKS